MNKSLTYNQAKKIVNEYETKRREEKDKQLAQEARRVIGKCFKFRNSYGSGESWWCYIEVVGMEKGYLITETFQETPIEIEIKRKRRNHPLDADYKEISHKEFDGAKKAILNKMNLDSKNDS